MCEDNLIYHKEEYKNHTIKIEYDDWPGDSPRDWDNLGTLWEWHRRYDFGDKDWQDNLNFDIMCHYQARELTTRSRLIGRECCVCGCEFEAGDWIADFSKREARRALSLVPSMILEGEEESNRYFHEHCVSDIALDELNDLELFYLAVRLEHLIYIPVQIYEHGGITIRASHSNPYPDQRWDSGQVGFIFVHPDKVLKEWGARSLKDKIKVKYSNQQLGLRGKDVREYKVTLEKHAENILRGEIDTLDQYLTGQVYGYVIEDQEGEHVESCWGFYGEPDGEVLSEARSIVDHIVGKEKVQP